MLSNDCKFVIRVINSCKTMPQLKVAMKLANNSQSSKKYSDKENEEVQRTLSYKNLEFSKYSKFRV